MTPQERRLVRSGVVFLDALGTQAAADTSGDEAEEFLEALLNIEETVVPELRSEARWEGLEAHFFSDLLCLSVADHRPRPLRALTMAAARIQLAFARHGVFLRGGMTLGPHYQRGRIAFGPALDAAYDIERKVAKVPLVRLDDSMVQCVREHRNGRNDIVPIASDGEAMFVDFLQLSDRNGLAELRETLRHRLGGARERAAHDCGAARAVPKLEWLDEYLEWHIGHPAGGADQSSRFAQVTSLARFARSVH